MPAPTAHPLVEEIVWNGGEFEIVEAELGSGEPLQPKWTETVEKRLANLEAEIAALKTAARGL